MNHHIAASASRGRRSFACWIFAIALLPAGTQAANFVVSQLGDAGSGSLRDAVDQANRTAGTDTVSFNAGLNGTITLSSGEIEIFDALSILGPGATRLSINGGNASRIFRIGPSVGAASFATTLNGLTLSHANSTDEGGAIFVDDSDLTVENCVLRNNTALRGGGLYAFPNGSTQLVIRNTRFENNTASSEGGGFGAQDIDAVVLDGVTATGNIAARNGGGGFLRGVNLTVQNSRFVGNTSSTQAPGVGGLSGGGALRLDGSKATAIIQVRDSKFIDNASTQGQGGGLWISALPPETPPVIASAVLERVQIEANEVGFGGGGVLASHVNLTLRQTTLAGNTAQQSGGGMAFQTAGALALVNATLSGNTSALAAGGGLHSGSGTTLSVASSSLVGNSAASGGGIFREGAGATLRNSLIANNSAPSAPDASGAFTPSYSLVKNTSGATLGAGSGNLAAGTDPLLGALAVNGGPTRTLLPATGSPVLNAGDPVTTGLPDTDQRGLPRIAGGRIDIGAAERQSPEDLIFRNGLQL